MSTPFYSSTHSKSCSPEGSDVTMNPPALQCGEELVSALLTVDPNDAVAELLENEVFKQLLPEVTRLRDTPQDLLHHPEGDVWTHTLMVIKECSSLLQHSQLPDHEKVATMLGALLHDIGKGVEGVTVTRIGEDGQLRITAHRHEELGVKPAGEILTRLGLLEFLAPVQVVVEHHMNVPKRYREHLKGQLNETRCILRTKKFLQESLGDVDPRILKICTVADQLGRGLHETRTAREHFASGVARMFDEALKN